MDLEKKVEYLEKLLEILKKKRSERVVDVILEIGRETALVFIKKLEKLNAKITDGLHFVRRDQIDDYESIINLVKEEFNILGIDIP